MKPIDKNRVLEVNIR